MTLTRQSIALVQRVFGENKVGTADGIPGSKTRGIIKEFQTMRNVPVTGVLDGLQFKAVTGCPVDAAGDPDYALYLYEKFGLGGNCAAHRAPGVPGRFVPQGVMIHHTGAWDGDEDPSNDRQRLPADRMINGRRGLSGPITQFGVSRDLTVDVFTNGRAHHAGRGSMAVLKAVMNDDELPHHPGKDDTHGNTHFLGVEVDHCGKDLESLGANWKTAVRLTAALCHLWRWQPVTRVLGHSEWTLRKTDPIYPMGTFLGEVEAILHPKQRLPSGNYAVVNGRRYRLTEE
jgi:hypothetical protein